MIRRRTACYVNLTEGQRFRRQRAPWRLLAALSLPLLAACGGGGGGDGATGPVPVDPYVAAAGTYSLMSVNGSAGLPASVFYSVPAPGGRIDINSGSMVLRVDKTFTETFNFVVIPTTGASSTDSDITVGTFALANGAITFNSVDPSGSHTWSGTLDVSATISYNDQGFLAVYKK